MAPLLSISRRRQCLFTVAGASLFLFMTSCRGSASLRSELPVVKERTPYSKTTRRKLKRSRPEEYSPTSLLAEKKSCSTPFDFNYKCVNDLKTDYDQDSRILTVHDFAAFVNQLQGSTLNSNAVPFTQLKGKMQLVYIEHLCEVYFENGNLPQLDQMTQSNSSYDSMADCYIDLFQRAMANSTFGYPSNDIAMEEMKDLCKDMYVPVTVLGYVSSCNPECVSKATFVQVCSEELLEDQGSSSDEYAEFIQSLQSNSSKNSSSSSFEDLNDDLQQNYINHVCQTQTNCGTPFGYPNIAVARNDVYNLCSDLFDLVLCQNLITSCDGTKDCANKSDGTDDLVPIQRPSPSPPVSSSPSSVSSQNSAAAFATSTLGIVVFVASGVAIILAVVVGFIVIRHRRQSSREAPIAECTAPVSAGDKKAYRRVGNTAENQNDLSDLISEAERSLTVAEVEALARSKKAHVSNK